MALAVCTMLAVGTAVQGLTSTELQSKVGRAFLSCFVLACTRPY